MESIKPLGGCPIQRGGFDVALVDLEMPDVDGFDVVARARSEEVRILFCLFPFPLPFPVSCCIYTLAPLSVKPASHEETALRSTHGELQHAR